MSTTNLKNLDYKALVKIAMIQPSVFVIMQIAADPRLLKHLVHKKQQ